MWLLAGLAGAALTIDTPTLQRVTGMVPTLALIPAVFLDRLLAGRPLAGWRAGAPARLVRIALPAGVLAPQTLPCYFGTYPAAVGATRASDGSIQRYGESVDYALAGRYTQTLNPQRDMIYQLDYLLLFWGLGPTQFLADPVHGYDFGNASEELLISKDPGKRLHFLVFPGYSAYLPLIQSYYPAGQLSTITRPDGSTFCTVYTVDLAQRAAQPPDAGTIHQRRQPAPHAVRPRPGHPASVRPFHAAARPALSRDRRVDRGLAGAAIRYLPAAPQRSGGRHAGD